MKDASKDDRGEGWTAERLFTVFVALTVAALIIGKLVGW